MRCLLFLLFLVGFTACGPLPQREADRLMDSVLYADSMRYAIQQAKYDRLQHLKDSILDASFTADGFEHAHARSVQILEQKENGFSLMVNAVTGIIYFVSKVTEGSGPYTLHDRLRFTTAKDTIYLHAVTESISKTENSYYGNNFEEVTFSDYTEGSIAAFVRKHSKEEIQVSAMLYDEVMVTYPLTSDDRKCISECEVLVNVLAEQNIADYY